MVYIWNDDYLIMYTPNAVFSNIYKHFKYFLNILQCLSSFLYNCHITICRCQKHLHKENGVNTLKNG